MKNFYVKSFVVSCLLSASVGVTALQAQSSPDSATGNTTEQNAVTPGASNADPDATNQDEGGSASLQGDTGRQIIDTGNYETPETVNDSDNGSWAWLGMLGLLGLFGLRGRSTVANDSRLR